MIHFDFLKTPVGCIKMEAKENKISSISFFCGKARTPNGSNLLKKLKKELTLYFEKKLKVFDVQMLLVGSDFQRKVLQEILKIPYGTTLFYSDIAKKIGNDKAARAVGQVARKNPIPIILPCHRVISKNQSLKFNYSGGYRNKKILLELENALPLS